MTVLGYFDLIQQNHAIGWALIPEQPTTRVIVEVVDGKSVIATGIANQLHGGLKEKNIGDSYYGFAIPLPTINYLSGRVLRCRAEGSSDYFNGEHLAISPQIVGNVDGISSGIIFGWVAGTLSELPEIEIRQGTKKIGCARITTPRVDIVAQGIADAAYSYYFDFKPFLKTKQALNKPITLIHASTDTALAGSPLNLVDAISWGNAENLNGSEIQGWATLSAPKDNKQQQAIVELWIDGICLHEIPANLARTDFVRMGLPQSRCGFKTCIPGQYLDGKRHVLTLRHKATGQVLANGEQAFTLTLRHAVTYANGSSITGWAFIEQAPSSPIALEAWENGRCIAKTQANQSYPATPIELQKQFAVSATGFTFALPAAAHPDQTRLIRLSLAGTTQSVTGKDILIGSRAEFIRHAEHAAQLDSSFRWWVQDWIKQLRDSETPDDTLYKEIPAIDDTPLDTTLDIIVPVYKGRNETLACLQSLLNCGDLWPHDIIVINDASPDPQLSTDLRVLANSDQRITLLENASNLGFVATVNRGMKLHPNRDVILLNSDTLVPAADWLTRLHSAAHAEACIATVTPFSNRATICSLPRPQLDNDLPNNLNVTELDQLCAQTNPNIRVDIPTAIGFCMLIKRQALNEVGLFDEERWAKGYGEENDFCIRAASIGWKHVAACDVFVQHHGAVSFQGEKQTRIQQNLSLLNALYPDYPETINRFIRRDPLSAPRSRIVLQLMKQSAQQPVLHITHAWGGGVQQHVDQLCRKPNKKGQSALILSPTNDGRIEIIQPDSDLVLSLPLNALANLSDPDAPLINYLQQLGVTAIHLHQWIGLPVTVWELAKALNVPFDYTVHDYYAACPRIHFIDYTGQFCEQAPLSRCELCVKAKPLESPEIEQAFTDLGGTVAAWRSFHQDQLHTARSIIAPCQDAANRIQKSFALEQVTVKAHDAAATHFKPKPLPKSGQPLRVAVMGAIGPNKGYDTLLALTQFAEQQAPHIQFFIVGYTMDDTPFETLSNVQITGKYEPEQLQSLLAELDCHVALFLSPWPETYSYTLSEALCAGLTPIVPGLGALGERVITYKMGIVISPHIYATETLTLLLHLEIDSVKGSHQVF
jgi:GT2 family glycosyltransferase/glycosyltransferase involved in cell wall biosynthesis